MRSPVLDLRGVPGPGCRECSVAEHRGLPWLTAQGDQGKPEFTAQATRQKRAALQGENPTGLQVPSSMQESTDQGTCVRKLPEAGKELVALTVCHSAPSTDSM